MSEQAKVLGGIGGDVEKRQPSVLGGVEVGREVQVRVAVAVSRHGQWVTAGAAYDGSIENAIAGVIDEMREEYQLREDALFILTATLPIPRPSEPVEVAANVVFPCCGVALDAPHTDDCPEMQPPRASAEEVPE